MAGVMLASLGILAQKRALLGVLKPQQYVAGCTLVGGGSVGQHLRHSIDHYRRCLDAAHSTHHAQGKVIDYDERDRGTAIETDMAAAAAEVDRLIRQVKGLTEEILARPVGARFMLSGEGDKVTFQSSVARELGFCAHHAIHHHALIKVIVSQLDPAPSLPEGFGLAPSTAHHMQHVEAHTLHRPR